MRPDRTTRLAQRMRTTFRITQEMVDRFVELTGDRSSIHVDEEVARRLRFRTRVVHGMLPWSFLWPLLQKEGADGPLDLAATETRFLKPVFAGDEIVLEAEFAPQGTADGSVSFEARFTNAATGDLLIRSKGHARRGVAATPDAGDAATSLLTEEIAEAALTLEGLADQSASFAFRVTPGLAARYGREVLGDPGAVPGANMLASLMLSTLVGMRLPGRYAMFTGFELAFTEDVPAGDACSMRGSARKIMASAQTLEVAAAIEAGGRALATGRLSVLVGSAPRPAISCRAIKDHHADLGVRGRVAVVIGSSRGIGAATAKLLAMLGAKVAVTYCKGESDGRAVVEDIRAEGGEAILARVDITDEAQVKALIARVTEEFGTVHVLVNNAVRDTQPRDAMLLTWSDYLGELEVSLKGMHHACQAVVPIFRAQGGGKIINVSTIFTDQPAPGQSKYITAKSAVIGYTRSLARELAKDNIQVNAVSPSMTETDLLAALPAEIVKRMGQGRPAGRNLQPIEVAQAVAFLASQWSSSMVGEKLVLNLGDPPFV